MLEWNDRSAAGLASREYGEGDDAATRKIFHNTDTVMLSFPRIVGNAESVAGQLREIDAVDGVSGILMTFQDYRTDVERFGQQVVLLLRA